MQISSRFTIAAHMLICMEVFKEDYKVTSEFLAGSIQVNPVMVRRLLQQLKKAGIIEVKRGSGGATIARPLEQITLLDIYNAVEPIEEGKLFHFHENHNILDTRLDAVQNAMEKELRSVTLKDLVADGNQLIFQ